MAPLGENHRSENIALVLLALFVAGTVVYALLTRPTAEHTQAAFNGAMPRGYEPVIAALVRTAGRDCRKLCGASLIDTPFGTLQLKVACAASSDGSCKQTEEFDILVVPTAKPSR